MSFLYPRVVAVTRPVSQAMGVGVQPYVYETPASEQAIASGLPASIQAFSAGSAPGAGLPGDMTHRYFYKILIPLGAAALGTINTRDIVTDELGVRYSVEANYWNSLGYGLRCERLEN